MSRGKFWNNYLHCRCGLSGDGLKMRNTMLIFSETVNRLFFHLIELRHQLFQYGACAVS